MSYVFDANTDPNERTRRRRLAEALMLKATDAGPIASPWQGAAKMAQALMGGIELGMYDKQDREGRDQASKLMDAALGGGASAQPSPVAAALSQPAQTPSFVASGGKMTQAPADLAPYFEEASKMTGIPAPVLMAKVRQESSFNPNAIGKAGEVGLTQIMPSTARDPGFGMQGVDPASLRDPRANIMFGAQYLAARGKAAGVTDWTDRNQVAKALTAYNGGGDPNYASNVMRFLPGGPVSPATAALAGGGGQPSMAGGDTLAPKAPAVPSGLMGAGQDTSAQQAAIMQALRSPYISAGDKQVLLLKYQSLQKDDSVTTADLGTSLGIFDKRGNLLRTVPKGKDPIAIGPDQTLVDPRTGTTVGTPPGYRPMTEDERKQFKVPDDVAGSIGPNNKPYYGPAANRTTVNTNPGPSAKVYETMEKRADEARAAAKSLPAFAEAKRLLDTGNITLGAGADNRIAMQKIGALFGMDSEAASNAETFRSVMAPAVLGLVKGLGAGSGISNADREFAADAAAGRVTLEPATIRRMIDIGRRASEATIKSHNSTLDRVYPEGDENNKQVRALFRVDPEAFVMPDVAPAPAQPAPTAAPIRKTIGKTTYEQRDGKWYTVD